MSKGKNVDSVTFVKAARQAKSISELAATLGLEKATVGQRLTKYRKAGVTGLPNFSGQKGGKKLDVAALNALTDEEAAPPTNEAVPPVDSVEVAPPAEVPAVSA